MVAKENGQKAPMVLFFALSWDSVGGGHWGEGTAKVVVVILCTMSGVEFLTVLSFFLRYWFSLGVSHAWDVELGNGNLSWSIMDGAGHERTGQLLTPSLRKASQTPVSLLSMPEAALHHTEFLTGIPWVSGQEHEERPFGATLREESGRDGRNPIVPIRYPSPALPT